MTFLRKNKATIPTKKVTTKAAILLILIIDWFRISLVSKRMAPKEAGIKRQKEKLKALIEESPKRRPEKIVKPERETPGRIAIAWKIPIIKAEK